MFKIIDVVECDGSTFEEPVNGNSYQTMACAVAFAAKFARSNRFGTYNVVETQTHFGAYVDREGKVWLDELAKAPYHVLPFEREIRDFEDDLPF